MSRIVGIYLAVTLVLIFAWLQLVAPLIRQFLPGRQWQTLFYGQRYSNTDLHTGAGTARIPDFVKLAEAYGAVGIRCERLEDVDDVIARANAINDRPVVIDFIVSADAQVWPMVAAGVSNDEIQHARGMSPAWEEE